MNNILLIVADHNHMHEKQKSYCKISSILDRIFYKIKIIDYLNNSLVEVDISNKLNDGVQSTSYKMFIINIPQSYIEPEFYGRKGTEKSYSAKKLIIDKINLFCAEEEIPRNFFSNKLLGLYHSQLQMKLGSEILSYEKPMLGIKSLETQENNIKERPFILGRILFRSLTLDILQKVCSYKKTELIQLDVTITGNKDNKEDIFKMIWKLSPLVKYLTIFTNDVKTEWLESEVEEIYNTSGLAINISNNYNLNTINSDVLINYGNIYDLNECQGLKRRTIIIDNSLSDNVIVKEKTKFRNSIVNSIEIDLPGNFPQELKVLNPEHFTTNQLAEILLGNNNEWSEEKMEENFKKEGFRISNLLGFNIDYLKVT